MEERITDPAASRVEVVVAGMADLSCSSEMCSAACSRLMRRGGRGWFGLCGDPASRVRRFGSAAAPVHPAVSPTRASRVGSHPSRVNAPRCACACHRRRSQVGLLEQAVRVRLDVACPRWLRLLRRFFELRSTLALASSWLSFLKAVRDLISAHHAFNEEAWR